INSVVEIMKKIKVFLGIFPALNGILHYYPDLETGRLRRSQYLRVYSIVHSLLMACGVPLLYLAFLSEKPVIGKHLTSHWLIYGRWICVITQVVGLIAIIYCAQFQQSSIHHLYAKLEEMEGVEPAPNDRRHLYTLLCTKLFIVVNHLIMHTIYNIWKLRHSNSSLESLEIVYVFSTYCLAAAKSLLLFGFLWRICYCGFGIQSQLKKLLTRRVKLRELQELFKRQQDLINLCGEFCQIFRHVIMFTLAQMLSVGIFFGYFLFRLEVTNGVSRWRFFGLLSTSICCFVEFYITNNMSRTLAAFIPEAIFELRQSETKSQRVERAINWMTLQLSCQNTEIQIYNIATVNNRLSFIAVSEVLLHILYMIQNDYYFFKK
ncbi:hypothetical protein KR215_008968, partial [Drosophila sulfurigaster]